MVRRTRDIQKKIWLTPQEERTIAKKMEMIGTENFGAYARKMLIDGYIIVVDYTEQKKLAAEINKIGVNINTVCRRINSTGRFYQDDIDELKEKMDENLDKLTAMATGVSKMVRNSVTAYVEKDLELARTVMNDDDEIDDYFDEIRDQIIQLIREGDGRDGRKLFDFIMVTKYLERIGDHATNIAEWVEFAITGVHKDSAVMH